MTHRTTRRLALLVALPAVVGLWICLVGDDIDVGVWLLIGPCAASGLVTCTRVRLVGPDASGGAGVARVHRQRSVAGDLALVTVGVFGIGLVLAFVAVARGEDDATIWFLPPVLALLGGGAALLGFLVGVLVVVPLVTLVGLVLGRSSRPVVRSEVLTCLLLPTITAFATLLTVSVDSEGSSRSFPVRSLPALLAGVDTTSVVVTSDALLWAARVALALLVAELVILVRAKRTEQPAD